MTVFGGETLSDSQTPDDAEARWRGLPDQTFDVVLADPPWGYYGAQDKWGAAAKFYETSPDEALLAFPMKRLMAKRSVLFLWATSPRLDLALRCIAAWGLHYRGVAFVWVKTRKDGAPIGAQGVRPSIVKPTVEYVLAASPARTGRPLPLADEAVANVVMAPRGVHSKKPAEIAARIERLYPDAERLELFCRNPRPGWSAWGDQVEVGPQPASVRKPRLGEPRRKE
jgi:N6-adenosine-specific RNA methylase IME4